MFNQKIKYATCNKTEIICVIKPKLCDLTIFTPVIYNNIYFYVGPKLVFSNRVV